MEPRRCEECGAYFPADREDMYPVCPYCSEDEEYGTQE